MKSQFISTQPRPTVRSLWLNVFNLALVLAVWGWASEAIAQIYQYRDQGPAVEAIQRALGIPADGIYGSQTEAAVSEFQRSRGLSVDGMAGPETLRALDLDYLVTPAASRQAPFGGVYQTTPFNAIASRTEPYVVVIPGNNGAELFQTQQLAPNAYIDDSRRGVFIRANSFARRSEAERLSRELRRVGLDARVAYRP